jgi:general stress protein 13
MTQYKTGKIVKGNITGIEKYGIFVNLDNYYSGLIHISEISDKFVSNINDYGKVGDTVYVKILEIDDKSNHMKLSLKNIKSNNENKTFIKETGSGFNILKENLDLWIEEKLLQIKQ